MNVLGSASATGGGVLVIHSWWGLTRYFEAFGQALAKAGFVIGLAGLCEGKTADTETAARQLRAAPRKEPMYKTLGRNLGELRDIAGGPVGVVGFSMGGHWAVWLSQRPEYRIAATVLYYAARGGGFGDSRSAYLAHFAEQDS